jgi:hypothetical protein
MSGGSYDYAYRRLEDFAHALRADGSCHAAPPALREAFRAHCLAVAMAMQAIEWNDSCDGHGGETDLIWNVLRAGAVDEVARDRLLKAARETVAMLEPKP